MSLIRLVYLSLAIIGAIIPLYFMLQWVQVNGFSFEGLLEVFRVNGAVRGLFWDLLLTGITLSIFIISETLVRRDYGVLICIPIFFLIGVSCGLPLYLFLRSRPLE